MSRTATLNFTITVNPIPFFINVVLIWSYVAEEGRCHGHICSSVAEEERCQDNICSSVAEEGSCHDNICSSVAEEGRCHDNIVNPVDGSVWRGFRMFHVLMFAAAVALVAIAALLLLVIRKDRSNCSRIGDGPCLPSDNAVRSYENNGSQILTGAINTTGDIKGTASGSVFFINKCINRQN